MPGPSPWPFAAAVFTAFFFLALTVQAYSFGFASGIVAVLATMRWLWETDRPIATTEVDVGAGIMLPTYAVGPGQPRLVGAQHPVRRAWAMIIFMAGFSYLYLFGIHPERWIAPPPLWTLGAIAALYAAGGRAGVRCGQPRAGEAQRGGARAVDADGGAALALAAATYLDGASWWRRGACAFGQRAGRDGVRAGCAAGGGGRRSRC